MGRNKGKAKGAFGGSAAPKNAGTTNAELNGLKAGLAERVSAAIGAGQLEALVKESGRTAERLERFSKGKLGNNVNVLTSVSAALDTLEATHP